MTPFLCENCDHSMGDHADYVGCLWSYTLDGHMSPAGEGVQYCTCTRTEVALDRLPVGA